VNAGGAVVVAFTLAVNLTRGAPLMSIAVTGLIALILHWLWARSGRPSGVHNAFGHGHAVRIARRPTRTRRQ
jgi:hypothetical protein